MDVLQPQLLRFTANEHLNTAPFVMSVLTICPLKLTLFLIS